MLRFVTVITGLSILIFGVLISITLVLGRILPAKQLLYISAPLSRSNLNLFDLYHRINVNLFLRVFHPAWSPDGEHVTFLAASSDGKLLDLYIMNVFTRNIQPLIKSALIVSSHSWSPDGHEIAFASFHDKSYGIYVMSVDCVGGFEQCAKRITTKDPYFYYSPTWSPDGKHIVFVTNKDDPLGFMNIYIMNRDGSYLRRLTENPGDDENPSWSPDSRYLVYSAGSIESVGKAEMMIVDTECNVGISCSYPVIGSALELTPDWSSDGHSIVFVGGIAGKFELYVINLEGHYLQRLTYNDLQESDPRWRP